jgi:hypothetical protein
MPSFESSMGAIVGFFIACCLAGRPDLPMKMITEMRVKALKGTTASWGCPSIFVRGGDCKTYVPGRYK